MKGRMQKISTPSDNCPRKDRTASESYAGVQTFIGITENNLIEVRFGGDDLLERIVSPTNLNRAYKQVMSNRGSGGVDRMRTEELLPWLHRHKESLINSLMDGTYRPCPVLRVEIPKGNGQTRPLGIPTVVDRLVQQSISQVLTPLYEVEFSETSYGFRPKRGCHDGLRKAQSHINSGYKYAVDLDLEKFFDTVSHSRLIEVLSRKIRDGRVISLIHKYLHAGVQVGDRFGESLSGVSQGGPLSPLLGNIMLDELDKELERRGHPFVRYADDCMIFCRSKRAAERTRDSIVGFIENRLHLRVNREKTKAGYIIGMKFLGYSFYVYSGKCRLSVHPKSLDKFKTKLKELTGRSNGMGYAQRKESLRYFIMGWLEYFKLADMKSKLQEMDMWYRRRLRMCIWKNWKRVRSRFRNLIRCGIEKRKAWEWANTRKGYWHISNSWILSRALNNDNLRRANYPLLMDCYRKVVS
ncbi:MAG TPA: group II intron reverse transcriptase/maturase [Bacteroidales bacterium]|nr:group II intron reverse transcriptase/maturase [Bacteroidales bacterium]